MQIELIEKANKAINDLNWIEYARMLDPIDLERFQNLIMPGVEKLVVSSPNDSVNLFGKLYNSEEIQNLNPDEFFAEIMSMACELSEDLKNTYTGMNNLNIGAVAEGDTLVHIVTRTDMPVGPQSIQEINVFSVKKIDDDWKVVLSSKIEGIAIMIRRGLPQ